jgi:ABC-type multidrug transport system fused ATPase/permease subunit
MVFVAVIFRAVAQTGVVASGASYVAAFIPLIVVTLYFVQKYYLRTSRQMRFLDIEMKAPLYTHFTETLAGASTVRAFGWSDAFLDENTRRLNASQKPFYLMFCIQRWLQVVLDLFVAGLALVLVALALRVTGATSQGAIGLALVNLLEFSQTLTLVIDQWTQLETSLGAIARLKWFSKNTPNESREAEKEMPPGDWPARGAIEFENVDASYSPTTSLVLNEISLRIEPGQKVGVCGRSGR